MRATSRIVFTATFALASGAAWADAKSDAMALHQSVVSGLNTFIELGENSSGRSKALGEAMDKKVHAPVDQALAQWRKTAGQSASAPDYQAFNSCDVAATSLLKVSGAVAGYIKSDSTDEPDFDPMLDQFAADLTECEKKLEVKLTF